MADNQRQIYSAFRSLRFLSLQSGALAMGGGSGVVCSQPIQTPIMVTSVILCVDHPDPQLYVQVGTSISDIQSIQDRYQGQNLLTNIGKNQNVPYSDAIPLVCNQISIGGLTLYFQDPLTRFWFVANNVVNTASASVSVLIAYEVMPHVDAPQLPDRALNPDHSALLQPRLW